MDKLLHSELLNDYRFKLLMHDLEKISPIVPRYDPQTNNIEAMKFGSARQQMYEAMMAVIRPSFNDNMSK